MSVTHDTDIDKLEANELPVLSNKSSLGTKFQKISRSEWPRCIPCIYANHDHGWTQLYTTRICVEGRRCVMYLWMYLYTTTAVYVEDVHALAVHGFHIACTLWMYLYTTISMATAVA